MQQASICITRPNKKFLRETDSCQARSSANIPAVDIHSWTMCKELIVHDWDPKVLNTDPQYLTVQLPL